MYSYLVNRYTLFLFPDPILTLQSVKCFLVATGGYISYRR